MKSRELSHKRNIGLMLMAIGLFVFVLPFILVAVDNTIGDTKPADLVINNFGVLIITAGPLLVLAGLLVAILRFTRRPSR